VVSKGKPGSPRFPAILGDPIRNRGVAFSAGQRDVLGLTGRLPPAVLTLDEQSEWAYRQLTAQPAGRARNLFLERLHDRNETLFFKLLSDHLAELLPVVDHQAAGGYPDEYWCPRGIYLSIRRPGDIGTSLATLGLGASDVDVVVCSDGEQIPGIGDGGGGSIRMAVATLATYTAGAGIHPDRVVPVSLDTGTDNQALGGDPFYLGNRQARSRGQEYDAFLGRYVEAVSAQFPQAMLHFEAFSAGNARHILHAHGQHRRIFSNDRQGTGAVVLAAVYAASRVTGIPMKHQEVVVWGAGAAGAGLADQLRVAMIIDGATDEQARSQIWLVGPHGPLFDDTGDVRDFQRGYAKPRSAARWASGPGPVDLADTIAGVAPTILLGASAAGGTFTQPVIQAMCRGTSRPVILPISVADTATEATPSDIIAWSGGKALVASRVPAGPVDYDGTTFTIGQATEALVYPGLGLGIIVSRASRVTPHMLQAAAAAVAEQADASQPGAPLLPGLQDLRACSALVAEAVVRAAVTDQVASYNPTNLPQAVHDAMWRPGYPDIG
jgi:malate dehydrogenase (oxaloacetate-decarboxylating)